MKINEIDHCALTVTNLEHSFDWFKNVFDLEIIRKWKTTWMIGKGEIKLGLFQRPNGKPIEDLDSKIGFQNVSFLTDCKGFIDVQVQLQTQGIKFEGPEDTSITYSILMKDPDGNQFEITTYYQLLEDSEALPIEVMSKSQCCDRRKNQT